MNEELKALLEQAGISTETFEQLATILQESVDAALEEQAAAHKAEMAELKEHVDNYTAFVAEAANEYAEGLKESAEGYTGYVRDALMEEVKGYAEYAATEFIRENKERLVETEKFARMQAAFELIKESFELNGFPLEENAQAAKLEQDLKEAREAFENSIELVEQLKEEKKKADRELKLMEASIDLTLSEREQLRVLVESVDFSSDEEFDRGLGMLIEQVSGGTGTELTSLTESVEEETPAGKVNTSVNRWVDATRSLVGNGLRG